MLEQHGGICDCQTSRDTFVYAASADTRGLEAVTRLLADVVLRPKLSVDEVNMARQTVAFELESLSMRPEQDLLLTDMIHAAAFRENTLGLPKLCPVANLERIDRDVLLSYLRLHHNPARMVVAGCGVDHDAFVQHVEKYFNSAPATWDSEPIVNDSVNAVDRSVAQYTGGMVKVSLIFDDHFVQTLVLFLFRISYYKLYSRAGGVRNTNLCGRWTTRIGTCRHW